MKKTMVILMAVAVIATVGVAFAEANAAKIDASYNNGRLEVSGQVAEKGVSEATGYLGCTIWHKDKTHDMAAITVTGNFSEFFSCDEYKGGTFIVKVWAKKVENCGCSYCKENGYHLENCLASKSGELK